MIQKQHYESPSVKILAEEFEENIMSAQFSSLNGTEVISDGGDEDF